MKKVLYMFAAVALLFASCTKEQDLSGYATADQLAALEGQVQTQVYQFSVAFPAVNEAYESTYTYNGLKGKLNKNDAALVYMNFNDGWAQLPYCQGNEAIVYFRKDDGTMKFSYGRAVYVTFSTEAFTAQTRVIVIPETAVSTKSLSTLSYEEAMAMAGLTEADVQNI